MVIIAYRKDRYVKLMLDITIKKGYTKQGSNLYPFL